MTTPWPPARPPAVERTEDSMTVTSRLDIHVSHPPRAFGTLQWLLDTECPPDWVAQLVRFGGGVFHSPGGLAASETEGRPAFSRRRLGGHGAARSLGSRGSCPVAAG